MHHRPTLPQAFHALQCGCFCALLLGSACAPADDPPPPASSLRANHDHGGSSLISLDGLSAIHAQMPSGELLLAPPAARPDFQRLGLRYDGEGNPQVEVRFEQDGVWSEWHAAPITFNDGRQFNAHVGLDRPAQKAALRIANTPAAKLSFLVAEFFTHPLAEAAAPPSNEDAIASTSQALAPASLVHPRSAWGAAATPNCGNPHTPKAITIHHTVTPNNDPTPPAKRIKGIQNYHINANGWCDIGYHFLVSQDGERWQGWKTETKSGIHVGGHNTNNVGISFLGSYQNSEPPAVQVEGVIPLVQWLADTYGIALDRKHLLGHREWSGNSTSCPGNRLFSKLDGIVASANNGGKENHVDIAVDFLNIAGQEPDFIKGSSSGIFDVLVDQPFMGQIVVRNGSQRPATDDVRIGYSVSAPYLSAEDVVIERDRPQLDGKSFKTSPASSYAGNPTSGSVADSGSLNIGSLLPGESVRVRIDVRAAEYAFAVEPRPQLRAWIQHVGDYYGEQDGWDDSVEQNQAGSLLRAASECDILSRHEWDFDGPDGSDVEGWRAGADISDLAVNLADGALAMKASGPKPHALSPDFTRIDTTRHAQLTLRVRQHGDVRHAAIYFRRDTEAWSEERKLEFSTTGGGVWDDVVLNAANHPEWSGVVTGLRLDPWRGGPYTGADAWFDIDFLRATGELPAGGGGGAAGNTSGGPRTGQATRIQEGGAGSSCTYAASQRSLAPVLSFTAALLLALWRRRRFQAAGRAAPH